METRIRLAIRSAGLPLPVLQHPVGAYDLDMAYSDVRLAVEYDGREHLTPERARRDLVRQAYLSTAGWTVLRFGVADVRCRPWVVAAAVRRALIARGVIAAGRTAAPSVGR
jgi:very-short-patch-repair endonuclease